MRNLFVAAALLLLAATASASHLETVFSVAMPYAEVYGGDATLFGDALYVLCGEAPGVVQAVNLTTRMNIWTSPNYTDYGGIASMAVTSAAILLFTTSNSMIALSTQTGQQLWMQASGYIIQYPPTAFSYGDTIYAQVSLPQTGYYALQAFDLATGEPGYFQYGNELLIDGNTAFVAQYNVNGPEILNSYLRAIDIPTNTTLWIVPCADQAPNRLIPAVSSEYVAISNLSGSDEVAVVLHRKNGSVAQAFQAFNGFANADLASFHGNMLFALIGLEFPRYVLADLTTGYITWTRSAGEVGGGGVFSGTALVTVSQSLVLTITPLGGSSPSISIPQVPSLPGPTVVDFGSGLVQVGNLQGYTLWDTNTGDFVGSNEQDPNAVLSTPLKWNGLTIMVSGDVVSAVKVVS